MDPLSRRINITFSFFCLIKVLVPVFDQYLNLNLLVKKRQVLLKSLKIKSLINKLENVRQFTVITIKNEI